MSRWRLAVTCSFARRVRVQRDSVHRETQVGDRGRLLSGAFCRVDVAHLVQRYGEHNLSSLPIVGEMIVTGILDSPVARTLDTALGNGLSDAPLAQETRASYRY